jgi:hypothetical protein
LQQKERASFGVLTAALLNIHILWDVTTQFYIPEDTNVTGKLRRLKIEKKQKGEKFVCKWKIK